MVKGIHKIDIIYSIKSYYTPLKITLKFFKDRGINTRYFFLAIFLLILIKASRDYILVGLLLLEDLL